MKTERCDVHRILPEQVEIHTRLENWARWGRSGTHVKNVSPMFKQYRSRWRQWHEPEYIMQVYEQDAMRVEKAVMSMAERYRDLLLWFYIWRAPVRVACKAFGVTELELWMDANRSREILDNALRI